MRLSKNLENKISLNTYFTGHLINFIIPQNHHWNTTLNRCHCVMKIRYEYLYCLGSNQDIQFSVNFIESYLSYQDKSFLKRLPQDHFIKDEVVMFKEHSN